MQVPVTQVTPTFASAIHQEILDLLQTPGCHALGVCGLGGSGKTTAAQAAVTIAHGTAVLFQTDWYCAYSSAFRRAQVLAALDNNDQETLAHWADPTHWYNWSRMLNDLHALRSGARIVVQDAWRQSSGECDLQVELEIAAADSVIVVDGIYLLHEPIRSLLARVILLEVAADTAHARTSSRDAHRVDSRYLDFKQGIISDFELPYFERYREQITRKVSV